MLHLSRKIGEKIVIGKDIVIEIIAVRGKGIRIGIQAPKEIPILREELSVRLANNKESK